MILNSKEQIIVNIENQLNESIVAKIHFGEQSVFKTIGDMISYIQSKKYRFVNEICGMCEFMSEHRFYGLCCMIEDIEAMKIFEDRIDRWKNLKDDGYKKE